MEATQSQTRKMPLYWQEDLHHFLIGRGFEYSEGGPHRFRYFKKKPGVGFDFKGDMVSIIGYVDGDGKSLIEWHKFTNPGTLESLKQIVKAYLNSI